MGHVTKDSSQISAGESVSVGENIQGCLLEASEDAIAKGSIPSVRSQVSIKFSLESSSTSSLKKSLQYNNDTQSFDSVYITATSYDLGEEFVEEELEVIDSDIQTDENNDKPFKCNQNPGLRALIFKISNRAALKKTWMKSK
ncbi:hypothetical protein FRX31_008148 [Thalictrum thalictroides]|uniref:Uncharacterized protein n=1 Tax=Thalictrum thalictroides TaxID=46969 RepID=A0A7J6X0A6_THATH|nr:hypothetical protein FRX31_008148 [Thalictrum thalictroides]